MKRKFDINCPVGRALNALGDGWSIMILRNLFLENEQRFQDFQDSIVGLAPSTLSDRLKKLEQKGLLEQRLYSSHPPRAIYRLTEKGRSLGPILKELYAWGEIYQE